MDLNYLRRIVKIFDESTLENLEIEEEGLKIKFARTRNTNVINYNIAEAPPALIKTPAIVPEPNIKTHIEPTEKPAVKIVPEEHTNFYEIKSPMVGTFYRSPSPDAPPFVEVGQSIHKGQVLCIIEAMKLMNQIESEVSGTIEKILVDNAKPVEFGQPLFLVKVD